MRNKLVAAAIAGMVATPAVSHAAGEVSWFGFNQITAFTTDSNQGPDGDAGGSLAFGGDRIRIGYKAKFDSGAFSKLQVDFNRGNPGTTRGGFHVPDIIKDAVVGYDFGAVKVQAGERKVPVGMDYNTSGKKLDIVNRGMEKNYVLERAAGLMVSGGTGPAGVHLWLGNPATRAGAIPSNGDVTGDGNNDLVAGGDYSYAIQGHYNMGKMLHAQLSYGASSANEVGVAEDYTVMDLGLKSQPMPNLTLKAEYLQASNVGHADGRDQTVWYVHGGYEFTPMMEGVVRHYNSTADTDGAFASGEDSATLSETYVGLNVFLNPEKHHEARIQLNYILPSGDTDQDVGQHRSGTVVDDGGEKVGTFKAMFQTAF